jgi:hypothetical protein
MHIRRNRLGASAKPERETPRSAGRLPAMSAEDAACIVATALSSSMRMALVGQSLTQSLQPMQSVVSTETIVLASCAFLLNQVFLNQYSTERVSNAIRRYGITRQRNTIDINRIAVATMLPTRL